MKLSKTALIFRIIFPTIFGISGIVVPLILFRSQDKQEPLVGKIETVGGDVVFVDKVTIQENHIKEELENQALYGKVISVNDTALADVEIGIVGGSQVFSDSNGEFKIYCKPGQLVRFKKWIRDSRNCCY